MVEKYELSDNCYASITGVGRVGKMSRTKSRSRRYWKMHIVCPREIAYKYEPIQGELDKYKFKTGVEAARKTLELFKEDQVSSYVFSFTDRKKYYRMLKSK